MSQSTTPTQPAPRRPELPVPGPVPGRQDPPMQPGGPRYARLYPTPRRRELLDDVARESVRRGYAADQTEVGFDLNTRTDRRVTADITELERAGWVELNPTLFATGTRGFQVRYWKLTSLGAGIRQIRMMTYDSRRTIAETGAETDPTVIGTAEQYEGIRGRWLVTVGAEQVATSRSQAVAELWHMAALAVADQEQPALGPVGYRVEFARIGRRHDVDPLTAYARDADELAEFIYKYARPYLVSQGVDVEVNLEAGTGTIFCGFQVGGTFTISRVGA